MIPTLLAQSATDLPALSPEAVEAVSAMGYQNIIGPYMGIFFIAFFVAFITTPIMRVLATRNGIVDWPDLHRKNHIEPVAYLGGVAIFAGWFAGVCLSYVTTPHDPEIVPAINFPLSIILGGAAIVITGLFDDVYSISPRVKVGGQLFAAAALAANDVGTQLVANTLGILNLPAPDPLVYLLGTAVIAVFVVGGCNAMNLIDGLDGLAAGVAAIACVGFLIIAAMIAVRPLGEAGNVLPHVFSDPVRIVMCLAILGALLGFLPFNFNPASIFMGDAGSLLVGYLCVSTILLFSLTGGRALLLVTAALIVFALPITDTSLAIFRRKMRGQPILSPDNQHIHHLLRRSGLSVRKSVMVMYATAIIFAGVGVSLVALDLRWRYVLAVFFVIYGFIFATAYKYGHRLAYIEKLKNDETGEMDAITESNGETHAKEGHHTTQTDG